MIYQKAYDWAIAVFEADVALFPSVPDGYELMATAYLRSGDEANALRWCRKTLEVDPDRESAKKMLEQLH